MIGSLASEAIGSIRTIASLGLQEHMVHKFSAALVDKRRALLRSNLWLGVANGVTNAVIYIVFAGVFGLAVFFIDRGWMEPDEALKVFFPLMFSVAGIVATQTWAADRVKAREAVTKVFNTVDRVPSIDVESTAGSEPHHVVGRIEFVDVKFRYPARPTMMVFERLNLTIEAETTAAIVGPSGSGKSTVIALVQRFYDPQAGAVLLDATDIRSLRLSWLRSQMALVQQEPVLFGGTIMENISYGCSGASAADVESAAKLANAHGFTSAFPDGYRTRVGERGVQLSGGQKQRIAIARAIIRDPFLLLLDEATSALDSENERIVQETLDQLLEKRRGTALVISHRLSTIQGADQIFVIFEGNVVEKGTHTELLQSTAGHYSRLIASSSV